MANNTQDDRATIVDFETFFRITAVLTVILAAFFVALPGSLEMLSAWYRSPSVETLSTMSENVHQVFLLTLTTLCGLFALFSLAFAGLLRGISIGAGDLFVTIGKALSFGCFVVLIAAAPALLGFGNWLLGFGVAALTIPPVALLVRGAVAKSGDPSVFVVNLLGFTKLFTDASTDPFGDEAEEGRRPTRWGLSVALAIPVALAATGVIATAVLLQFAGPAISLAYGAVRSFLTFSGVLEADAGAFQEAVVSLKKAILILVGLILIAGVFRGLRRSYSKTVSRVVRYGILILIAILALATISIAVVTVGTAGVTGASKISGVGWSFIPALLVLSLMVWTLRPLAQSRGINLSLDKQRYALRTAMFWRNNKRILAAYPQPKKPIGYLFLATQADTYTIASLLLILCRLRQLGWVTVILDRWPIRLERTGDNRLNRLFGFRFGEQRVLNYDWKIDWDNGIVEAAGINFYHPIWEGLSRHFGRYTIRLENKTPAERAAEILARSRFSRGLWSYSSDNLDPDMIFNDILKVADSTLLLCFRILNTVAGQGLPVRIIGGSGQFVPNAIYNIFCREVGKDRDMHFVWLQQGYQTYYKDKSEVSTRISLQNMTRKWPYSNPYLPHKDDFERWMKDADKDVSSIIEEARAWTKTDRATSRKGLSLPAQNALDRIVAHRARGGKVVCVFGKMVFDLSTPWEKGPAHAGMLDWLNHTVESVRGHDNILLVIKPHPYEARPEIAGRVEQYFTDMIEQPIPDNVLILGHDWFNLHAMFPHIDAGVLWNGTSGLELGLQGIPTMICSDWGPVDYPVGLCTPRDRADYEFLIRNPERITVPDDYAERCALLLKYTAEPEVMIPYEYAARPLTNKPFGPPYWHMDQVRRFMREGDKWIDLAASRVL